MRRTLAISLTCVTLALAVSGTAEARPWSTTTGPAYQDAPSRWLKHWQCHRWQRNEVIRGYVTTNGVDSTTWYYTHHKGKPVFYGGVSYVCSR